jgi:hypothetical protein
LISSDSGTSVLIELVASGASTGSLGVFNEVEEVFGHASADVASLRSSMNSDTVDSLFLAAVVRLQRDIENPGPFNDDSKAPEYIFIGFIDHVESGFVND